MAEKKQKQWWYDLKPYHMVCLLDMEEVEKIDHSLYNHADGGYDKLYGIKLTSSTRIVQAFYDSEKEANKHYTAIKKLLVNK